MKKLKIKVFLTIFIIFNIFSISLLLAYNYQSYNNEFRRINDILNNNRIFSRKTPSPFRFIDNNVYTVYINNGEALINSYSQDGSVPSDLESIITKHYNNNDTKYIGNLYNNKYSYKIENNLMIIVDNSKSNERLVTLLEVTLVLLVILELLIYFVSSILSKWIIKPAIDAFDAQKRFIADASHELKTPLAVIMASADALEKDKKEKKWISNIQNESERMNNLIKSLLDLSKIESTTPVTEDIDLSKLVIKSTLVLESLMFEKNIELKYDISENIIINANSEEIKQLVTILLDNAIKHSESNGKILVNLNEQKNNVVLEVKNKGKSIEKGQEEKIFERFYRVDESRNRNENRYGLGLAIAKTITNKYNGNISASSSNGYTTFKVVFKKK